jgi:predicted dinucleotide-binding enzyme
MHTKKTVAIIGAGDMGKAIALALSKGNERVLLADKNFAEAEAFSAKLLAENAQYDIEAVDCSYNAAWEADVIILAVPCSEQSEVINYIKEVSTQKIVIAVSDTFNEDIPGEDAATATEKLQQLLPDCKVARAIKVSNKGIECFLKGNDKEAANTITELFKIINSGTFMTT